jgi:iron complex outermembrane receptor protein
MFQNKSVRRYASVPLCAMLFFPAKVSADSINDSHAHEHQHQVHDEVETIIVTASPLEHNRDELAIPVDRVDRDQLIANLGSTIGESINHIPGIAATGFTAGASRPVIRGQDVYRSEVLVDGLRPQDVSRESPDHGVPINALAAQRIEIVRGPATLRYGGGASAGVVNIITNLIPDRIPDEPLQGEIFGGIGLVANERDLSASLKGKLGNLAWGFDGLLRRSNDYSIPSDDPPHVQSGTSTEALMGSIGAAYFSDTSRVGFSYRRAESVYGIPASGGSVEIDMQTDHFRVETDLVEPIDGIREIRFRGLYSKYEHDEIASGTVNQTYRNREFEGRAELVHDSLLELNGALGIHVRIRDFQAEGEAAEFLGPTTTTTAAAYLYEEYDFYSGFSAEIGARIEHTNLKGRNQDSNRLSRDFLPVSGALSVIANPLDWLTIGLRGAFSQRAPSQVELFARGAHEATQTFEIGDPEFDEERSATGDFRAEIKGPRGLLAWSGFVTRYEDFIFSDRTGNHVDANGLSVSEDDSAALAEVFYRDRDAIFFGTELFGTYDLLEFEVGTIGIDGRFDFVRARFTHGRNRNLPRIVPIRWGGGLFFRGASIDARIDFLRTEAQENIGAFEQATAGFTTINISMMYQLENFPATWTLSARNLLDVRGRNHIAFNKDEVLRPGRDIRFGLRIKF